MLIEFAAENFKSLKDLTRFSMLSTKMTELPSHKIMLSGTKPQKFANKLAVFFGPNASGKSNVLSALLEMRTMVNRLGISRAGENEFKSSFYTPYALCGESKRNRTLFQAVYIANGKYFRYGYSYDAEQICEEWLYSGKIEHEALVFFRNTDLELEFGGKEAQKAELKDVKKHLTKTNLCLAVGADLKNEICANAASFFSNIVQLPRKEIPFELLLIDEFVPVVVNLLSFADTGITHVEKRKEKIKWREPPQDMPEELGELMTVLKKLHEKTENHSQERLIFRHSTLDDKGECSFYEKDESSGTIAYLRLAFTLCMALHNESIAIIDEFDENLHPLLVARLLQFFTSLNICGAQLICTSHSPVIFSPRVIRRDELWITEKDAEGRTFLNNASDYKDARNDGNLTQRYLEGRFGGIPLFNETHMVAAVNEIKTLLERRDGNFLKK